MFYVLCSLFFYLILQRKNFLVVHTFRSFIISLTAALFLGACQKVDLPVCDRTVLVYMVASNSLKSYVPKNIEEIKRAVEKGALNGGNMLLYIDQYNSQPVLERISLKNGVAEEIVIKTYEDDDSVSPEVMRTVIDDVVELYPAASYGLILWSHANGWYPTSTTVKARSFGSDEGASMNIPQLAEAIPDGIFDFIICDACYMGCVEVAYELRHDCRYYISSPAPVMGKGFPYEEIVPELFFAESSLEATMIEVCREYMRFYYQNYNPPCGTISLVDMNGMEALASEVKSALQSGYAVDRSSIQQFSHERGYENLFFDLDDYLQTAVDASSYEYFSDCLKRTIIYADATDMYGCMVGISFQEYPVEHYCGLTSYIQGARNETWLNAYYRTLSWYKAVYE